METVEFIKPQYEDVVRQAFKVGGLNIASVLIERNMSVKAPLQIVINQLKASFSGGFAKNHLKPFNM